MVIDPTSAAQMTQNRSSHSLAASPARAGAHAAARGADGCIGDLLLVHACHGGLGSPPGAFPSVESQSTIRERNQEDQGEYSLEQNNRTNSDQSADLQHLNLQASSSNENGTSMSQH